MPRRKYYPNKTSLSPCGQDPMTPSNAPLSSRTISICILFLRVPWDFRKAVSEKRQKDCTVVKCRGLCVLDKQVPMWTTQAGEPWAQGHGPRRRGNHGAACLWGAQPALLLRLSAAAGGQEWRQRRLGTTTPASAHAHLHSHIHTSTHTDSCTHTYSLMRTHAQSNAHI